MQRKRTLGFGFRNPEQLESRELLAGHGAIFHGAGAAFGAQAGHFASAQAGAQAASRAVAASATGALHAAGNHAGGLTATLTDANSTLTGTASYKSYTSNGVTETEFSVSITGATAGAVLDVTVGGVVVGQITADDTGAGKLALSSNPSGTESALPADFPAVVDSTTTVSVGTASGTFATATPTHSGGCHRSDDTTTTPTTTTPTTTTTTPTTTTSTIAAFGSGLRRGRR